MTLENFNSEIFHADTLIKLTDLETALCTNPPKMAFYIEQAALWSAEADRNKTLRDNKAASVTVNLGAEAKRPPEHIIKATYQVDPTWIDYNDKYNEAKKQLALYEGAVHALDKKQFSVQSLYARQKSEFEATNTYTPSSPEERQARKDRFSGN